MILDIDDSSTVVGTVEAITKDWFNVRQLYWNLKDNGETESSHFWMNVDNHLLKIISNNIGQSLDEFLHIWKEKCLKNDLKIMGYHCTRYHKQEVFKEQGILPLTESIIDDFISETVSTFQSFKLSHEQKRELKEKIKEDDLWKYRSGKGAGPYFLVSYKDAQRPQNHFRKSGSEVLWSCADVLIQYCQDENILFPCSDRFKYRKIISEKLIPMIIHCTIPFSILPVPDIDCYTYYMIIAYFNFIDPEEDLNNFFEGHSIDLKGNSLDRQYIIKIE